MAQQLRESAVGQWNKHTLVGRAGKITLGTLPLGRKGRYQMTEITQCPPRVEYDKEEIPVWPNPTKAMRNKLQGNARFDEFPGVNHHIASSTGMLMEWEQKKEKGENPPEPCWPVLWTDNDKAWMFKPRWSDIDVLLAPPRLLSRPQMLTWLKGEKFHQYSHTPQQ